MEAFLLTKKDRAKSHDMPNTKNKKKVDDIVLNNFAPRNLEFVVKLLVTRGAAWF